MLKQLNSIHLALSRVAQYDKASLQLSDTVQVCPDSMTLPKGLCSLLSDQITLEIFIFPSKAYKWTSKPQILSSLSKLLALDRSDINLVSVEYLPFLGSLPGFY